MITDEVRQQIQIVLEHLSPEQLSQALSLLASLLDQDDSDLTTRQLMLTSEAVLAKDWLNPEEDEAWQDL